MSATVGYFLAKKIDNAKYDIFVEQAKAKAKVIEHEAQIILNNNKAEIANAKAEIEQSYKEKFLALKEDVEENVKKLEIRQKELNEKEKQLIIVQKSHEKEQKSINKLKSKYEKKLKEAQRIIENGAGMTKDEAKKIILERAKDEVREESAHITRKAIKEAEKTAKKEAFWVIAQATTRFAGEFAGERLVNIIHIKEDDIKGKIIGKDGKNIKSLEMTLGVDIIIDDTPNAITISSFNIYRRQIAVETIKRLIDDGRIHPARIEETFDKVNKEFEEMSIEKAEEVIVELGLGSFNIHPELIKLLGKLTYRASYGQNALAHSIEVANLAGTMAAEMGGDELMAKRAGLFHDIGKALTVEYSGSHIDLGYDVAKRYNEPEFVLNGIKAHHGQEDAKSIEVAAVCTADILSAARPGARREVVESFLKRIKGIEEIASSFDNVKSAYAINAGREVRVIVESDMINDDEAVLISQEIAKEIEHKISYPGEIKVTVVREMRAISYAS